MASNGVDGSLSNVLIVGDVQGQQGRAILDKSNQACVGQAATVSQRQALHPGANGERHDAAVVDLIGEGGKVEPLDEITVVEVRLLQAQRLADAAVVPPVGACRPVP